MTSTSDGVASITILQRDAEELSRRLTNAAELSPQTATHTSGRLAVTVDSTGRPTDVSLSSDWQNDIAPEDLAGAVQATAAMAEQLRLDAWTANLASAPTNDDPDAGPR